MRRVNIVANVIQTPSGCDAEMKQETNAEMEQTLELV